MGDGVFSRNFWLLVRDYVAAAGVEPLTLGETEPRIWQKILQAMIANGLSVSAGSSRAAMLRVLRDALATGGGGAVQVTPPGTFALAGSMPFNIMRTGSGQLSQFSHSFSMAAVKPTPTHTIYCGAGGSDAANGQSWANRVASLKQAATMANAIGNSASIVRILVQAGRYAYPNDWSGVIVDRTGLIIEPCDGAGNPSDGIFYSVHQQDMPAFVSVGSSVYCSTYTTELPQRSVWDESILDAEGDPIGIPNVPGSFANEAAIIAGIGAYHTAQGMGGCFLDTVNKKLYVRTQDGRAPDANVFVGRGANSSTDSNSRNFYQSGVYFTPKTIWVKNMRCYGGMNWVYAFNPQGHTIKFYHTDCRYLHSGYNDLTVMGDVDVTSLRCVFGYSYEDGIGYTLPDGAATANYPKFFELDCVYKWNGQESASDTSKNASSTHDTVPGVRVNGRARKTQNRAFNDIAASQSWNLGVIAKDCRQSGTPSGGFAAGYSPQASGETAKVWLDACLSDNNAYDLQAYGGAALYYANMDTTGYVNQTQNGGTINTYNAPPVLPGATGTLSAMALSDSTVQLAFTNASGATGYQYRLNGGGSWLTLAGDKIVTGLTQLTLYGFEVRAINGDGTGAVSNSVNATTQASPGPASIFSGGDMSSTAGWNAYYGGSSPFGSGPVAGQMVVTPVGGEQFNANSKAFDSNPTAGKYYEVSIDVSSYVGGSFRVDFVGGTTVSSATFNSNGTKVFRLQANAGNTTLSILLLGTGGTNNFKLDNLTVVGPYNTSTVGGA